MYTNPSTTSQAAPQYATTASASGPHPSMMSTMHAGAPIDYMSLGVQAARELGRREPKNAAEAYNLYKIVQCKQLKMQKMHAVDQSGTSLMEERMNSSSPEAILAKATHQKEKVITHSISIAGTLEEFANGTVATTWKASDALKNLPVTARLLPIANTILKERNTTPVKVGAIFEGLRHFELDNAMTGSADEVGAHYYVEGGMYQPNSHRFSLYHRDLAQDKKVRNQVSTWSAVTHEGIDKSVHMHEDGEPYMYVFEDSPILDVICRNPETYGRRVMKDTCDLKLDDGRKIVTIPAGVGSEVKSLTHRFVDSLPFGSPQTISAKFVRADGRAWNDRHGLGATDDQIEQALEERHQIDLVFQQRFHVWTAGENGKAKK